MKKVDESGAFESEDETGFIFQAMRDITFGINSYFQNYTSTEEEPTKK
jgi:hypothetical protein